MAIVSFACWWAGAECSLGCADLSYKVLQEALRQDLRIQMADRMRGREGGVAQIGSKTHQTCSAHRKEENGKELFSCKYWGSTSRTPDT
jgi:hypothetical protein